MLCPLIKSTIAMYRLARGAALNRPTNLRFITLGDPSNGVRSATDSVCRISDIIGRNIAPDQRLPAGDVLGLMDLCAARTAMMHLTAHKSTATVADGKLSVATVAADNTSFKLPILSGDTVVVRGTPIHVGKSSIGVFVEVSRTQFPSRVETLCSSSFFTMVAIDKSLKKANVVPALKVEGEKLEFLNQAYSSALKRGKAIVSLREELKQPAQLESLRAAELETPINASKRFKVPFEDTRIEANRLFFPGHLNFNNTIFGGELMRWMEMHAAHCGRMFVGHRNIVSIGMHSVFFDNPVYLTDWVTLEAHVAYVHNTTMEVDVKIVIEREGVFVTTNRASFILISLDEIGQRRVIETGLDLAKADQKWLRRYSEAKTRYTMQQAAKSLIMAPAGAV